jgi:hypothetical protein
MENPMKIVVNMLALLLLSTSFCWAAEYDLQVEQKGAELFKLTDQDVYVLTQYCFVDVGATGAHLDFVNGSGTITFKNVANNNETSCDVIGVYGKSPMAPGSYRVVISRSDDNWYSVADKQAAVLTSNCLASAESIEAGVVMAEDGSGTLTIAEEECAVVGLYAPIAENQE